MAFVHGKSSIFQIDDSGGTLRTLTTFIDSVTLPNGRELADVTAMGDGGHRQLPGLQNVRLSVSGHYDPTATTGPNAVLAPLSLTATATSTWNYGPEGSAGGATKFTGEAWVENYTITSQVTDKVSWTADIQVDGIVTLTTF